MGPTVERTFKLIGFPSLLYAQLRDYSESEALSNRSVIRNAVDKHLPGVLKLCAQAGFAPGEGERKMVRTPLDPAVKDLLDEKAEESGVDATALLMLCLRNELELRLTDKQRNSILARMKRRLAKLVQ